MTDLSVFDLNNRGVALLESGRREDALIMFKQALGTIKTIVRHIMASTGDARIDHHHEEQPFRLDWTHNPLVAARRFRGGSCSFVYSRGLVISPNTTNAPCDDNNNSDHAVRNNNSNNHTIGYDSKPSDLTKISEAIVYNVALTHHIGALEAGNNNNDDNNNNNNNNNGSSSLRRALQLYHKVKQTLSIGGQPNHVLAMSILNNIGQIKHELELYEDAEVCFEQLEQALIQSNPSDFMDRSDYEGMLINTLSVKKEADPAAAA